MRLSLTDAYLGLICLFPVMTTAGGGMVNRTAFVLLLAFHLWMVFSRPIKKRSLHRMVGMVLNYAFMLKNTDFPLNNYNLLAYFPFFLMYTCNVCDQRERILRWFSEHIWFLRSVIFFWCALVAVSALLPGCYQVREGGRLYFGSFCKDIFRLGPSAVFIQILILLVMILRGKKGILSCMAVPMYCYLMGSSRTYLVIGFLLFVIGWYLACSSKRVFWGTVIPLGVGMLLLVAVSALGDKIAYTLDEGQYGDFWYRITSSRSYLWGRYWEAWKQTSLLQKLLGNDLEFTQNVAGRWAHNDFLEILCSFGVLGLTNYLGTIGDLLRQNLQNVGIPFTVRACAELVWLFNAMFNMYYVYFCAMLGYPLLVIGLRQHFRKDVL